MSILLVNRISKTHTSEGSHMRPKRVYRNIIRLQPKSSYEANTGCRNQILMSLRLSIERIANMNRHNGLFHCPNRIGYGHRCVGISPSV